MQNQQNLSWKIWGKHKKPLLGKQGGILINNQNKYMKRKIEYLKKS